MFFKLLVLFTVVPLIELALLIKLGQLTSVATTVAVVIFTGIVGAGLARREGFKTWSRIQHNIQQGISPADDMVDGLLILIAGAVLITPGLLTDALGFGLLIPPLRRRIRKKLSDHFRQRMVITTQHEPGCDYEVIDVPPEQSTRD